MSNSTVGSNQSAVKLGDGVATTTMDITERKKAEWEIQRLRDEVAQARLRESEERLAAVRRGVAGRALDPQCRDAAVGVSHPRL